MPSTINADNGVVSGSSGVKTTADTSGVLALQSNGSTGVTLDTSLNVGVGTTTPAYKVDITSASDASLLQVKSTAGANNTALRLGIDGNNSFINASGGSTGALQLRTYGTTQATLDSAGNLGLGVTPSAWAAAYKAIQLTDGAAFSEGGGNTYLSNNWFYDGTNKYIANGAAAVYGQSGGSHQWYTAPSGTAGDAITFTQAMTLDASGNLALGTTSAGTKLVLATSDADTAGQLRFARSVDVSYYWEIGRDNNSSGAFIFSNAAGGSKTERARITSAGAWSFGSSGTATGTSGQVLTSGGSGAAPSWSTPSSGSMVKLATITASSSSSIDFTGFVDNTLYQAYQIYIGPAQLSTNTFLYIAIKKSGSWVYSGYNFDSNRSSGSGGAIIMSGTMSGYSTAQNFAYVVTFFNDGYPLSAGPSTNILWNGSYVNPADGTAKYVIGSGSQWGTNADLEGIQFYPNGGNIRNGDFVLYGIKRT